MVKVFLWVKDQSITGTTWYATGWLWQATGLLDEMLIMYKYVKWVYTGDLCFIGTYAGQRYMIQKSMDDEVENLWQL